MSVRPNTTDTYCDPADVARYFRTVEAGEGFTFDSNPSKDEVKDFIMEATARVDRETGHAWRARTVTDEYHDLDNSYYWWAGLPIKLMKRQIRPLDASKGDKLEIYDGSNWEEWLSDSSKIEGRDEDYWLNEVDGMLYLYLLPLGFDRYRRVRVTYRYGEDTVPPDIQKATAMLTAVDLIRTDIYGDLLPTGGDSPSPDAMAENLEKQADRILERRKEVRTF